MQAVKVTYLDVMEVQKEEVIPINKNLSEDSAVATIGNSGFYTYKAGRIHKWIPPHRILEVEFL